MDVYDVDGSLNFMEKGRVIIDRMEIMQFIVMCGPGSA